MDSLKLNMVAVDQIFPLLSDLVSAMLKVGGGGALACLVLLLQKAGCSNLQLRHLARSIYNPWCFCPLRCLPVQRMLAALLDCPPNTTSSF